MTLQHTLIDVEEMVSSDIVSSKVKIVSFQVPLIFFSLSAIVYF